MPPTFSITTLKVNATQRMSQRQTCLYSNQIEHLPTNSHAPAVTCTLVLVEGQHAGIYNRDHLVSVRFFPKDWNAHFQEGTIPEETMLELIKDLLKNLRLFKQQLVGSNAEAFRWVHGDSDGLPGIVIDDYGDLVVVQSGSAFGEFLIPLVTSALLQCTDKPIFERSSGQVRALEKLPERTRWIRDIQTQNHTSDDTVRTQFAGLEMRFRPRRCQKTGLFLDQRNNLDLFRAHARAVHATSMIDLCSYVGAWSSAGAQAGITEFTLVDQDKDALDLAKTNISFHLKSNAEPKIEALHGDLFEMLSTLIKGKVSVDALVADPPAFTKSAKHVPEAKRAYQRLTKLASQLVRSGGLYVACSCSRHISEEDFYGIVSSSLATDDWIYLGRGRQSPDHTVLATDKQSLYLKVLFFMRRGSLNQIGAPGHRQH